MIAMRQHTLEPPDHRLISIFKELAPRAEELARKSAEGTLSDDERREYAELVRLNDVLSLQLL